MAHAMNKIEAKSKNIAHIVSVTMVKSNQNFTDHNILTHGNLKNYTKTVLYPNIFDVCPPFWTVKLYQTLYILS